MLQDSPAPFPARQITTRQRRNKILESDSAFLRISGTVWPETGCHRRAVHEDQGGFGGRCVSNIASCVRELAVERAMVEPFL